MALADKLRKICLSLGKNNKPTYAVIAIASVKGICRPMFTMMDKTEKPETKKYTALREGLTEIIAIPVYWASGELAGSCSKFLTRNIKKEDFIPQKIKALMKDGIKNEHVENAIKDAAESVVETKNKVTNNLRLAGVCTAALLIIPAVCSAAIKPVVHKIIKPQQTNDKKPVMPEKRLQIAARPKMINFGANIYKSNYNKSQTGFRIGGLL